MEVAPKMVESASNRRQHSRYRVQLFARISSLGPVRNRKTGTSQFQFTDELCADISLGGAFIAMREPLEPGQRLLVEFHLPSKQPLEAIAQVMRSTKHTAPTQTGIGVAFEQTTSTQRALLEALLSPEASELSSPRNRNNFLD